VSDSFLDPSGRSVQQTGGLVRGEDAGGLQ
jgi:hypothetical protein